MGFQTLPRLYHVWALQQKILNFGPRIVVRVNTQVVSPQDPGMFQTDLGSLISPTEKT